MKAIPDLIVLHDHDNIATALRTVPQGTQARVTGTHGSMADLVMSSQIRLGHKAALRPIAAGQLVVKHGHPIGRATEVIAAGEHVHVHNVASLSRETDLLPHSEGGGAHG